LAELPPNVPLEVIRDLLAWWRKARVRGMIIGGLAVTLIGKPRLTHDVDGTVDVEEARWQRFLDIGEKHSFRTRNTEPVAYARGSRMFLLTHGPTDFTVDLAAAGTPFELEAIRDPVIVKIGRFAVPVAKPEVLIVMKAIANRTKDQGDVAGLLAAWPTLDFAYIRRNLEEVADALAQPEIIDDFERLVEKLHKKKR
jgi:hypothetical protein